MENDELMHYGVLGMKWGVTRAHYKSNRIGKLEKKAVNYDKKAAVLTKRSEKAHAKNDLGFANRSAIKAAKLAKRAAVSEKKALKTNNDYKRVLLEKKAANLKYKSSKKQIKGNRLSKTTGYGVKAMNLSIKSDKVAAKAAKARKKIANDKAYISMVNRRMDSLSPEDYSTVQKYASSLK